MYFKHKKLVIASIFSILTFVFLAFFVKYGFNKYINNQPSKSVNSTSKITTIKLRKNDYIIFGKYQNSPIVWKIININKNNRPQIFSEKIICFKPFDVIPKDNKLNSLKYGTSSWKNCSLQIWLNSTKKEINYGNKPPNTKSVYEGINSFEKEKGFLCEDNFTCDELNLIYKKKISILSKSYIKKHLNKKERIKHPTKAAILSNSSPFILTPKSRCWYWTSSNIKSNNSSVCAVTSSGNFYKSLAFDGNMGVCPSAFLKSNKIKVCGGDGTKETPYLLYCEMNDND